MKHDVEVMPKRGNIVFKTYPATIWLAFSFAPEWFKDAARESKEEGINARRREIIFAVCCVESYLVEWVRDGVLNRSYADASGNLLDYDDVTTFFPLNKVGIKERWKNVLKKLYEKDRLPSIPDFTTTTWREFCELIDYRDGLIHATVSLPDTDALPEERRPTPLPQALAKQQGGWAVKRIINLLIELHEATRTSIPDWVKSVSHEDNALL